MDTLEFSKTNCITWTSQRTDLGVYTIEQGTTMFLPMVNNYSISKPVDSLTKVMKICQSHYDRRFVAQV